MGHVVDVIVDRDSGDVIATTASDQKHEDGSIKMKPLSESHVLHEKIELPDDAESWTPVKLHEWLREHLAGAAH